MWITSGQPFLSFKDVTIGFLIFDHIQYWCGHVLHECMKKLLLILLLLVTLPSLAAASVPNPFGVMISGDTNQIKTQTANALGAIYYRPISLFLDKWTGTCAECDTAVGGGLKLVLTIRNNNGGQQNPTTPPTDWNKYKSTLSQIVNKYKPAVLIIENEENSAALFYNGTAQQYLEELKAGCEVAHQKQIKCANGGLVSSLVALLVADSYKQAGDINKANEYLARTLGGKSQDTSTILTSSKAQEQIAKGKALLAGQKVAGADFSNFHWYIRDTGALGEAVSYLRSASGLPVMTNEVGQQGNADPNQVTGVMQKIVDLGLPYAVWFSMDTNPPNGARALNETNGTLRSNGLAYKQFIKIQLQTTAKIPGDLNGDGKVDIKDYNIIVAAFGHPYTIFDYNILVGNFGK